MRQWAYQRGAPMVTFRAIGAYLVLAAIVVVWLM